MASSAHFLDIPLNILPRVLRNHRPEIDGEPVGLADAELFHGTLEHCEQALGNVVLEAKQSQRRRTLATTVKCRCDDVRYDLLGERAESHNNRILANCLSDKPDWFIVHQQATGQLLLN